MLLMISEIFHCLSLQWRRKVRISHRSRKHPPKKNIMHTQATQVSSLSPRSCSFGVVLYKPKVEAGYKPEWSLLNMTLDGWLEQSIRVVSNCDALMRSDLKGLVRRRHADRRRCARCSLLGATPHQKKIKNTEALPCRRCYETFCTSIF